MSNWSFYSYNRPHVVMWYELSSNTRLEVRQMAERARQLLGGRSAALRGSSDGMGECQIIFEQDPPMTIQGGAGFLVSFLAPKEELERRANLFMKRVGVPVFVEASSDYPMMEKLLRRRGRTLVPGRYGAPGRGYVTDRQTKRERWVSALRI